MYDNFRGISDKQKSFSENDSITLKVLDHLNFRNRLTIGPVISGEDVECILDVHGNGFGRVLLPAQKIGLPKEVKKASLTPNSLRLKSIRIEKVAPTSGKSGFWDIITAFTFTFFMTFLDRNNQPFTILMRHSKTAQLQNAQTKREMICLAQIRKKFTLFGLDEKSPMSASDLFVPFDDRHPNAPHVLIDASGFPLETILREPGPSGGQETVLDCNYCEPKIFIFLVLLLNASIRLFRFSSSVCPKPEKCGEIGNCDCICLDDDCMSKDQ